MVSHPPTPPAGIGPKTLSLPAVIWCRSSIPEAVWLRYTSEVPSRLQSKRLAHAATIVTEEPPNAERTRSPFWSRYATSEALTNFGRDETSTVPTVVGWLMSVMSRTTSPVPPRSETRARLRLEGADAENCGTGWTAGQDPSTRTLEAVVVRLEETVDEEVASP